MKEYDGFLVDDDLNIYSKRTGRMLTPYVGTDGLTAIKRIIPLAILNGVLTHIMSSIVGIAEKELIRTIPL